MKRWRSLALFFALGALLTVGLLRLFDVEFAGGELYPEYSSLRASPMGAKLLYASLGRLPGLQLARNYLPFDSLTTNGATLLMLSADPMQLGLDTVEKVAGRGNRVVICLPDKFAPDGSERWAYRKWHLKFPTKEELDGDQLFFKEAEGWNVFERDGDDPIAIERNASKGTVVLFARSEAFSNQAIAGGNDLQEVTAALGPATRVIFDESHLGIAETGSVMGLAKRFRLLGFAAGLALLAALFIWRNAGSFPPATGLRETGRPAAPIHGLQALLRKHIAVRDLAAACWKEWSVSHKRDVSADRLRRAEAIVSSRAGNKSPREALDAVLEIHTVLHSKGQL
jgi:hypothetical protein